MHESVPESMVEKLSIILNSMALRKKCTMSLIPSLQGVKTNFDSSQILSGLK